MNKKCRESPKILGVANSFASGVFIAIALVHILPEEAELWEEINPGSVFPLPYFLMFVGYTLILIIDKVLFDTHALFDHDDHDGATDPAEDRLHQSIKRSFSSLGQSMKQGQDPRKSMAEANATVE